MRREQPTEGSPGHVVDRYQAGRFEHNLAVWIGLIDTSGLVDHRARTVRAGR
jgi:hypothetical protein